MVKMYNDEIFLQWYDLRWRTIDRVFIYLLCNCSFIYIALSATQYLTLSKSRGPGKQPGWEIFLPIFGPQEAANLKGS